MIQHFSSTYAYLLILHIFLIFTSFKHIFAQNILQKNQLYQDSALHILDQTKRNKLEPAEKQALYVRKAFLTLDQKAYKQVLNWSKNIAKHSYFAPLKPYFQFKTALLQAQEQLKLPLNKNKLKRFANHHQDALKYQQQLVLGFMDGFKQDLAQDQKTMLFHTVINNMIEKKSSASEHAYLYQSHLSAEQRTVLENVIQLIFSTKKSQSLLAQITPLNKLAASQSSSTEHKPSQPQSDASLTQYQRIEKAFNKTSLKKHAELMLEFPNSVGAQQSQQDILHESRSGAKSIFLSLHYDFKKPLPFDLFYKLGHQLWNQKEYTLAQLSFKKAHESHPYHQKADQAEFYIARIFEDQSKWQEAQNKYLSFIERYPSSDLNQRVHFKLGLIAYILNQESQAKMYFNQHYHLSDSVNEKAQSIFWQMRLAQKFKRKTDVARLREQLHQEAPLSYYAAKEKLWPSLNKNSIYKTSIEPNSMLYEAHLWTITGLHQQALGLLKQLNIDSSHADFALYLSLLHANKDHTTPVILAFSAIHKNRTENTIDINLLHHTFPTEFSKTIAEITQQSALSTNLILAIIKQESAFNPKAKSPAGAYGLMQLMPNTAKSLFSKLNFGEGFANELLYQPEINLELGKLYLQQLHALHNGNLIYLASNYNAGQTPLKTWQSRWATLDEDIFIEMIPYKETREYNKLVLRNYYFYEFLNDKNIDK